MIVDGRQPSRSKDNATGNKNQACDERFLLQSSAGSDRQNSWRHLGGRKHLALCARRRDGADARRDQALHGHPDSQGREEPTDDPDAHVLQRGSSCAARRVPNATGNATTPAGGQGSAPGREPVDSPRLINQLGLPDEVFVSAGWIRIYQDVRGKYNSEGPYLMTPPPVGPFNATGADDTTDGYDTIDWLVKNVPESNGRVGMLGASYEGYTVQMALLNPAHWIPTGSALPSRRATPSRCVAPSGSTARASKSSSRRANASEREPNRP